MIGRNYSDQGEIITSGDHFVKGAEAVRHKVIRFLRKIKGEDSYDRTNGVDIPEFMTLASSQQSLFARSVSDYLKDNIPEILNVISVEVQKTENLKTANVKLVLETVNGVIEI